MKILLEVPDKQAAFFLKVLRSFTFVKSATTVSDSQADLLHQLNEASEEVRLHKQRKLKLNTLQQFLDGL